MSAISCKYRLLASGVHVYAFNTRDAAYRFIKFFGGHYDFWSTLPSTIQCRHVVYLKHMVHNSEGVIPKVQEQ